MVFLGALKGEAQLSRVAQAVTWGERPLPVALRPHDWGGSTTWLHCELVDKKRRAAGAARLVGPSPDRAPEETR